MLLSPNGPKYRDAFGVHGNLIRVCLHAIQNNEKRMNGNPDFDTYLYYLFNF